MVKSIIIFLRYLTTLSSLSVMAVSRKKLGQNTLLPIGIKFQFSFTRILMRFFIVMLLYLYIRIFFIIEVKSSDDPSPFDSSHTPWELLTEFGLHAGWGAHVILYYYSFVVAIMGLAHIFFLEVYYRHETSISRLSLGESWLFGKLEGRKIFGSKTDDFFVNGVVEPVFIIGIGYLLSLAEGYISVSAFLIMAGIAMFLQALLSLLDLRAKWQDVKDAELLAGRMRKSKDKKGSSLSKAYEDENVVTIAE